MLRQVHVKIRGDVTKVGFRGWARMKSRECKVTGYLGNVYHQPDEFGPHGGVEGVIQGEEEGVQDMLAFLHKGSPLSRVDDIQIRYEDPTEIYEDFTILKSRSFPRHD